MKINLFVCGVLFLIFGVILPTILVFSLKKHQKALKIVSLAFLVPYIAVLLIGTFSKIDVQMPNLTFEFDFSQNWCDLSFVWFNFGILNVLLNLLMFFPLGFVVFVFAKKNKFLKTVLFAFAISLCIEILQWILPIGRNTELFDLILNTISGAISGLFCVFLHHFGVFGENFQDETQTPDKKND